MCYSLLEGPLEKRQPQPGAGLGGEAEPLGVSGESPGPRPQAALELPAPHIHQMSW